MKSFTCLAAFSCLACFAVASLCVHRWSSQDLGRDPVVASPSAPAVLAASAPKTVTGAARAATLRNYGKLPLSFEANQGQADPRVRFVSRSSSMTLLLTPDAAVIAVAGNAPAADRSSNGSARRRLASQMVKSGLGTPLPASLLRMKLIGANPAAEIRGVEGQPGKSNYFIGRDPAKWHTNVPNYSKVSYREIYRGVDLFFYGHEQQLEYDFVISPAADLRAIRLGFAGA